MTSATFKETGEGEPVVCLLGDKAAALMDALSDDFHVLAIAPDDLGASAQARNHALATLAQARGLETFALMAHGDDAIAALALAAAQPDAIHSLVLLSPTALQADGTPRDLSLSGKLGDVKAQVLALFGTRDNSAPPSMGGHYKRALPACHLMYVFDAADTANERLEAVSEVVMDFLKRRESFLVNNKDGRVHA